MDIDQLEKVLFPQQYQDVIILNSAWEGLVAYGRHIKAALIAVQGQLFLIRWLGSADACNEAYEYYTGAPIVLGEETWYGTITKIKRVISNTTSARQMTVVDSLMKYGGNRKLQ